MLIQLCSYIYCYFLCSRPQTHLFNIISVPPWHMYVYCTVYNKSPELWIFSPILILWLKSSPYLPTQTTLPKAQPLLHLDLYYIPGIFHQEFLDEIFSHVTGHTEILSLKLVLQGDDVLQSFFISVTLEWWQTAQSEESPQQEWDYECYESVCPHLNSSVQITLLVSPTPSVHTLNLFHIVSNSVRQLLFPYKPSDH